MNGECWWVGDVPGVEVVDGLGVVARSGVVEKAVILAQILQESLGSVMGTPMLEISYHHSNTPTQLHGVHSGPCQIYY